MRNRKVFIVLPLLTLMFIRCGMGKIEEQAKEKFGDQYFKTAIALIELHKIRFGEYPASIDSLKYTGDWDQMVWSSVEYHKLDNGYALDLTDGIIGKPETLEYPAEFWKGLGLVRSNIKK